MAGPIDYVYIDGVPVAKSTVRANDKTSIRRNMASVDAVNNADLSGQYAGIYVRTLQANFDLDTGDATTPDNGTTVLVDDAANRFKIVGAAVDFSVGGSSFWTDIGAGDVAIRRFRDRLFLDDGVTYGGEWETADITGLSPEAKALHAWAPRDASLWVDSSVASMAIVGHSQKSKEADYAGYPDHSPATIGVSGFAINDVDGSGGAWGGYFDAVRYPDAGFTVGLEAAVANLGTYAGDITPFNVKSGGADSGVAAWLQSGCGLDAVEFADPVQDAAAAIVVLSSFVDNSTRFGKGIVFDENAFRTSVGAGGNGVAVEYARGQSYRWLNSGATIDGEVYAGSFGMVSNVPVGTVHTYQVNATNVAFITGAAIQPASDNVISLGLSGSRWSEIYGYTANVKSLTVSQNVTTPAPPSGTMVHVVSADASANIHSYDSYGSNAAFLLRRANGTAAAQTGLIGSDNMGGFFFRGHDGVAMQAGTNASMQVLAGNTWSASDHSTRIQFGTTPIGSATRQNTFSIQPSGGISVGASLLLVDPGAGNVNIEGAYFSSTPVTKTGTSSSMGATDSSLIINGSASHTLTLLSAAANVGRWLTIKSIAAFTVVSASSNVVPLAGGAAGTAILAATAGKWARLQSDGTNWIVMEGN